MEEEATTVIEDASIEVMGDTLAVAMKAVSIKELLYTVGQEPIRIVPCWSCLKLRPDKEAMLLYFYPPPASPGPTQPLTHLTIISYSPPPCGPNLLTSYSTLTSVSTISHNNDLHPPWYQ